MQWTRRRHVYARVPHSRLDGDMFSSNSMPIPSQSRVIPLVGAFPATCGQAPPKAQNSRGGVAHSTFPEDRRLWACIYSTLPEVVHICRKVGRRLGIPSPQASL